MTINRLPCGCPEDSGCSGYHDPPVASIFADRREPDWRCVVCEDPLGGDALSGDRLWCESCGTWNTPEDAAKAASGYRARQARLRGGFA